MVDRAGGLVPYQETLEKSVQNDYQDWHVEKGSEAKPVPILPL